MNYTFQSSTEGQIPMTRAIIAVEMLSLNFNGIMEFKEAPTYQNVVLSFEILVLCYFEKPLLQC